MTLEPGTTLGRYQILAPLGHGGMASVYRAFQPALDRVVALKVLRPGFADDLEFLARFEREAKAIARLRHPHIVQVHDFDKAEGHYFMAMEYLEGGTLKQKLAQLQREGQGLPPKEAARILRETADALSYAHELGIVHRDVKPSNIMLTRDGRAVVTDFGIARLLAASGQTQTGVGIGTPEYMSPEQGQGQPVDQRSDIYALGVVAYELLTGRVPFTADTPLAVVLAHVRDPLPLPSRLNPELGPRTEQALLRALAKEPTERYARASDFAEALSSGVESEVKGTVPTVLVGRPSAGPQPQPQARAPASLAVALPRLPSRLIYVVGAALLLLVGGAVGVGIFGEKAQPPAVPAAVASGQPAAAATAPAATTARPAPTAAPHKPPHAIPAKGALLYEAKLDGTSVDVTDVNTFRNAEVRFQPGFIEMAMLQPGQVEQGQASFAFNRDPRATYVGELDLRLAGSGLRFDWRLSSADSRRFVSPWCFWSYAGPEAGMRFYCSGPDLRQDVAITRDARIDGVQTGRIFTLAVVAEPSRATFYIDEKQVAQVERSLGAFTTQFLIAGGGPGAVRIVGARFYALP